MAKVTLEREVGLLRVGVLEILGGGKAERQKRERYRRRWIEKRLPNEDGGRAGRGLKRCWSGK